MKKVLVILPYANSHLGLFIKYINNNYLVDYYIHSDSSKYRENIDNPALAISSIKYLKVCKNLLSNKYEIIFTHGIFYPYLIFLHLAKGKKIIVLSEGFKQNYDTGFKGILKQRHLRTIAKRNRTSIFMLGGSKVKHQYEKIAPAQLQYFNYGMFPEIPMLQNEKPANVDPIKFVFAGQFIERKNIKLMVKSISLTPDFKSGVAEFFFIGDGPELEVIKSEPNAKQINTLPKDQLFITLSKSDVLVLVSSFEGWGAIVNEACACGCALILSREIGAAELFFKEGSNGLYSETDPESLARIIKLVINDRQNLQKMKEYSKQLFHEQYDGHDKLLGIDISLATTSI